MDMLDYNCIYVDATNINDAYMKLIRCFSDGNEYESRIAIVKIKDVHEFHMPEHIGNDYDCYYKVFMRSELLDKKWDLSAEQWYLSYARRIMAERNGISPWNKAKQELLNCNSTRRGIITTYRDEDDKNKYSPPLLSLQFTINQEKLYLLTTWRSKELYVAFPMNVLSMLSLMRIMYNELKKKYKDLQMGEYIEVIGSLHKYANMKAPKYYGDQLNAFELDKVKFMWAILDKERDKEYDENYENQ